MRTVKVFVGSANEARYHIHLKKARKLVQGNLIGIACLFTEDELNVLAGQADGCVRVTDLHNVIGAQEDRIIRALDQVFG